MTDIFSSDLFDSAPKSIMGQSNLSAETVEVEEASSGLEFRSINGSDNNDTNTGVTGEQLLRLFTNAFEDGISTPRGGDFPNPFDPSSPPSSLPNPRTISNTIAAQSESVSNFLNASDWIWQWAQFIDHDLDLNESTADNPGEFTPIVVPNGDPTFSDGTFLPFLRVGASEGTGINNPRQADNLITSFIDASSVYGSDEERGDFLRSFANGQLKFSETNNGEVLLPENPDEGTGERQENATGGTLGDFQYVAGDIRANEQIGLTAVHTLFVREHNRLAADLLDRLEAGEAALVEKFEQFTETSDETDSDALQDEFIYQAARKVVGAKIQQITYDEFLPLLIGEGTTAEYDGYKSDVLASISTEFANAAYRVGHTLLSDQIQRLSTNGLSEIALGDAFFIPEQIKDEGVDSTLRGLILQASQEADNLVIDGVRNFLFEAGTGGLDLASVNIARGRDTGLPGYVEVYEALFGTSIDSFDDLGSSGLGLIADDVVALFEEAYETVDQIDLWIAGISEQADDHGGLLGPTFSAIIAEQFARTRDSDRFFYLNELEDIQLLDPDFANTSLSEVLRGNTEEGYLIQDNAFDVPYENSVVGNESNNILLGTNVADLIDGKEGRDFIIGRRGDDILLGDAGNDVLMGGQGNDTVLGGLGQDRILGSLGNDVLLGGDDKDIISGGSGNDTVSGGNGNDRLLGIRGNDLILGNAGNDLLAGGGGADSLEGGVGSDTLRGGAASDTFIFSDDILNDGVSDTDTIWGFQRFDSFDFTEYSGSIDFNRVSRRLLEIELNGGEDTINIFGSRAGLNAAQTQLSERA
ncbi:Leukotoxin [Acaryochloris thomasi RCC1774]|uniref:Leukotoxin n=1 Tax=Acaryochloris thomasi RCC1774 TaxID=1764569 RepID=A0A2W1JNT5_9CYAN|nr:peroxidase family protein [Acaryochloris thomasi]PZD74993.1 Leukotoxin [Acaryochloris thomasi RCC1774]